VNLKPFYLVLAVVAVAGAWFIVGARSGPPTVTLVPASVGTEFDGHTIGSDSALVEIIEYADFQCPACATFAILTGEDVRRNLVQTGRVRWSFRDFPLPSHPKAPLAHLSAACAGEQGRFWEMHDQLFFNQGKWVRDRREHRLFESYAQAIGLDMDAYAECIADQRHIERISAAKESGVKLGVGSTPSFIIGGRLVAGSISYSTLLEMVEEAEAAAAR
jgi:protein-disulfide isomerase